MAETNDPQTAFTGTTDNSTNSQAALEALVGEGKKFRDLEALAKSKLESDEFIAELQNENKEMRTLLASSVTEERVAEMLKQTNQEGTQANQPETSNQPSVDPESLRKLIRSETSALTKEEKETANVQSVDSKLQEQFGQEKAAEFVRTKAKELGVTVDYLQSTAASSPAAFFKLVDFKTDPTTSVQRTAGSQNTQSLVTNNTGEKNWRYYSKLRKEDKRRYYSPEVQREILDSKHTLGTRFFGE